MDVNPEGTSTFGAQVTMTAMLSNLNGQSADGGTVDFYDNNTGNKLGSGTISSSQAQFQTSALAAASYSIQARYGGNGSTLNGANSNTVSYTVSPVAPSITLDVKPEGGSALGQQVTMTATFDPASLFSGSVEGESIDFYNGQTKLATVTIHNNQAQYQTSALPLGTLDLDAYYGGDGKNFSQSWSNHVSYTVGKSTPTVSLDVKPEGSSNFGAQVTLTATLSNLNGQSVNGESVDFYNGNTKLGSGTINGTTAQFQTSSLAAGSYSFHAHYNGDATLNQADSSAVAYTVNKATPAVSLTVQPPTGSTFGAQVTLTATLSNLNGQSVNGESVDFYNGNTKLGSGTINGTTAQFQTSSLAAGSYSFHAHYSGDTNLNQADSSAVAYTVNKATPAVSLTVQPPTSSIFGAQVTLTATLSNLNGQSVNGESVDFYNGSTKLGSGTINGTTAQFQTSSLAAGSYSFHAQYSGDANLNQADSSAVAYTVNKATPTVSLTVQPPTGSTFGAQVTLTATLSNLSGQSVNGESVDFYNGNTKLGSGTINGTTAQFQTSSLAAGSYSFHAHYNGDANLNQADSSAVAYTVNKATPALSLDVKPEGSSTFGTPVTLTATLSNLHGQSVDGENVDFYNGSTKLGSGQIKGTTAQYQTSTLIPGSYSFHAHYNGDANLNQADSNSVPYTVNKPAPANVSLTIAPGSSVNVGTLVTLTAKVTPATTGTVYFCEAAAELCTDVNRIGEAQLENGTATFEFVPGIGSYSYAADFAGANTAGANRSNSVSLNVAGKYATETTLGKPTGTGPYNIPVSVTGIVPPTTKLSPTGMVDLRDTNNNDYTLASVPLPGNPRYGFSITQAPKTLTAAAAPFSITGGDFNGDGIEDIAIANHDGQSVMVHFGSKDGVTPQASVTLPTSGKPFPIVAADFDNSGTLDIAVGNAGANGSFISVYSGDGKGGFLPTTSNSPASDFVGLTPGDYNNDGNLDLVVVHSSTVQIYLGDGTSHFKPTGSAVPPGSVRDFIYRFAAGDFNNDGKLDLAMPDGQWGGHAWILLGKGDGTFEAGPTPIKVTNNNSEYVQSVAVADFNQDGELDLAVGVFENGSGSSWIAVYQGSGDGKTFTPQAHLSTTGGHWDDGNQIRAAVAVGDFNGDGIADLVSAGSDTLYLSGTAQAGIWLGTGNWQFQPSAQLQGGTNPLSTITGDFNGDGFVDFAFTSAGGTSVTVGYAQPTATESTTISNVPVPVGTGPHNVQGHYEGDTHFKPSDSTTPLPLAAQKLTTALVLGANPQDGSQYGQSVTLTATLTVTGDRQGHTVKGETVTFYANGKSIGTGTLSDLSGDTATATLMTTALPTGTDSLTAEYAGDDNFDAATSKPLPYPVAAPQTATILRASPSTVVNVGQAVTLTATVTSGQTKVTKGTVYFCNVAGKLCDGANRLGEAQLTSDGTATLTVRPGIGATGAYQYSAIFVGTNDYASSTSSPPLLLQVRGQYATATTLAKPTGSGPYNLTATVNGIVPPNANLPLSGKVDMLDTDNNLYQLATAPLSGSPQYGLSVDPVDVRAGSSPYSIAQGDFNADGITDLAMANLGDKTIVVTLGTADGTFTNPSQPTQILRTAGAPYPIVTGDFDNNGTVDIAAGNGSNVIVFPGNGKGGFNLTGINSAASDFAALVPGDYNSDGNLDLAIVHSSSVQVYVGNGQNQFTAAGSAVPPGTTGGPYYRSAAGDFNNDGKLDLAVPDGQWGGKVWVLLGKGDGTFLANPQQIQVTNNNDEYAQSVTVADFDGDGRLDIAAGMFENGSGPSWIEVYQGGGDGTTFTPKAHLPTTGGVWYSGNQVHVTVAVGDFNGDGIADLASAGSDTTYLHGTAQAGTWLGGGNWQFQPSTWFGSANSPFSTTIGDFNGDGFADIAFANIGYGNVAVGFMRPTVAMDASATGITIVGTNTHAVQAHYEGNPNFAPSDSPTMPVPAQPVPVQMTLSPANGATLHYSRPGTLTAMATPNTPQQNHTTDGLNVTFTNETTDQVLGKVPLKGGQAVFLLQAGNLKLGPNKISAKSDANDDFTSGSVENTYNVIPTPAPEQTTTGSRPRM